MPMFTAPTYIVLDLPPPISAWITDLRSRFDTRQAQLPPEITVAGSSGLGVVAGHQEPEPAFHVVEKVARMFLPIHTAFISMERFPNSPVFWLKPQDRAPFDAVHEALSHSGIEFCASPFPFTPHCTVSSTVPHGEASARELLNLSVPSEHFVLATLRIYKLVDNRPVLLQSFPSAA